MTTPDLSGYTRVLSGARHEVYCNGKHRVWVTRQVADRTKATSVSRCPDCRCSAFELPKDATR
jgi:hypothetical protein